jgi:pimeloyl-ACP methyl ester carboxylesterase
VAPPREPALTSEPATFETPDKIPLSGTLYLSKTQGAPLLILVHRFRGDRSEWDGLSKRMAETQKRFSVLAFDLRGHGESRSSSGKKRLDWADMGAKDVPLFVDDVEAAMRFGKERSKATRVVLVGSSLGAAVAAKAASEDASVVALGLVSPGAQIEGYDVYHPFADVRMLPSFLAGAKDDNVSREPIDGLSRMAKENATVKSYDGRGHGAFGLSAEGDAIFADLEEWLESMFDKEPISREIKTRTEANAKKKEKKGVL